MHRRTAYLNSPIKKVELDLIKNHHKQNLQAMRPMNKSSIDFQFVPINKAKGQCLEDQKYFQIQKQNDILLKKINEIMSSKDKTKYHHSNKKASKSLNEFVKKQFQSKLDDENDKMRKRLELLKSTYQTNKIMRHWDQNKKFAQNASKFNFNIIDTPTFSFSRNRTFYFKQSSKNCIQRTKQIDGLKFKLKIMENSDKLRIVGDLQNGSDLRIIDIPKEDADILIKKHCHGKKQNLFKLLHYDSNTQELLLSAEDTKYLISQNEQNPEKVVIKKHKKTSTQKRKHILPEDLIIKNGNVSLPQIKKEKKNVNIKNPKVQKTKGSQVAQVELKQSQHKVEKNLKMHVEEQQAGLPLKKQEKLSEKKAQQLNQKSQKVNSNAQQVQELQKQEKNYQEQFQEENKKQNNKDSSKIDKQISEKQNVSNEQVKGEKNQVKQQKIQAIKVKQGENQQEHPKQKVQQRKESEQKNNQKPYEAQVIDQQRKQIEQKKQSNVEPLQQIVQQQSNQVQKINQAVQERQQPIQKINSIE